MCDDPRLNNFYPCSKKGEKFKLSRNIRRRSKKEFKEREKFGIFLQGGLGYKKFLIRTTQTKQEVELWLNYHVINS